MFTWLGLVIAFGWPLLLWIPSISAHQITSFHDDVVGIALKWFVTLLLAGIAFGVQGYKLSDFGLGKFGWLDGVMAFAGFVVAVVLTGAASRLVAMPSSLTQLQKIASLSLPLRLAVVCTAAICEEFIFRGFGIEELVSLVRNRWLAGGLSLVLFTVSHVGLYGWSGALLIPCLAGAILTGLYLWRHSLPACIAMHLLLDGLFVIVVPSFIHAK